MAQTPTRPGRGDDTRDLILTTAERLFAEHGFAAVSNRRISEDAGQANNYAVGYHFGSRADLVLAIVRRHNEPTERRRLEMLVEVRRSTDLHDWVDCMVRPVTEHLDQLGNPSWYARFGAQISTDPTLGRMVIGVAGSLPSIQETIDGMTRLRPALPEEVSRERGQMSRHLLVHVCAERERALQAGTGTTRATWDATATGLVDAIVGLWLAPVTETTE